MTHNKYIYLILAHKNPQQLFRLVSRLNDNFTHFYIHIDLKSDFKLFEQLKDIENVTLIEKRVNCIWGDFSTIIAMLNLIESALQKNTLGMCIFLSGCDYPIKSKKQIQTFIDNNMNKNFIDIIDKDKVWFPFNVRTDYYKINFSDKMWDFVTLKGLNRRTLYYFKNGHISFLKLINILLVRRKLKIKIDFFGGSQWWAMNIHTLTKLYSFIIINKKVLFRYFKDSLLPDEFFFQTILNHLKRNDPTIVTEGSLTYVNITRKDCKLPVTFCKNDLVELLTQPESKLFARKFEIEVDETILDKIDENT